MITSGIKADMISGPDVVASTSKRNASTLGTMGVGAVLIIAKGPVLGSMDSVVLAKDLICTRGRMALAVTITRSAEYRGATLKNVV